MNGSRYPTTIMSNKFLNKKQVNTPQYLINRKIEISKHKIISRKFGYLFLRKTCGKLYPSQGTSYYKMKLLRNMFQKWKLHWWNQRVEWRLCLRAICFYRLSALQHAFHAWIKYVSSKRKYHQCETLARNHFTNITTRRCLRELKDYCIIEKCLRTNRKLELQILGMLFIRKKCLLWQYSVIENRITEDCSLAATRFWVYKTLKVTFHKWINKIQFQKRIRIKIFTARKLNNLHLQNNVFQGWRRYIFDRKSKYQLLDLAADIHKEDVLKMYITLWRQKLKRRQLECVMLSEATEHYETKLQNYSFYHWRKYTLHKKQKNNAVCLSHTFYAVKVKQKVLYHWKLYIQVKMQELTKFENAKQYYETTLKKHVWNEWVLKVEERENEELFSLFKKAVLFWRTKLLRKYMVMIKKNVNFQRRKQALKEKSKCLLLSYYMQIWWDQWQVVKYEIHLENKAVAFYQMNCLNWALRMWQECWREKEYLSTLEESACRHHRENTLSRCLMLWNSQSQEQIQRRVMIAEASSYYWQRLQWRCFKHWKTFIIDRQRALLHVLRADDKFHQVLKRKVLHSWILYHTNCKVQKEQVECWCQGRILRMKKQVLCQWLKYVLDSKRTRMSTQEAHRHYRAKLFRMGLTCWHAYVRWRIQKQEITRHVMEEPLIELNKVRLQICLTLWRHQFSESLQEKARMKLVTDFHHKKLTKKCLTIWYNIHNLHKRKNQVKEVLMDKAKLFLLMRWFMIWKHCYQYLVALNKKLETALLFRSTSLQRKCFREWTLFIAKKNNNRKRYLDAMDMYHKFLLKDGVSLWLGAAMNKAAVQEISALKHASQISTHTFLLVYKYFNLWKVTVYRKRFNSNKLKSLILLPIQNHTSSKKHNWKRHHLTNVRLSDGYFDFNSTPSCKIPSQREYNSLTAHNIQSDNSTRYVETNILPMDNGRPRPRVPPFIKRDVTQQQQKMLHTYEHFDKNIDRPFLRISADNPKGKYLSEQTFPHWRDNGTVWLNTSKQTKFNSKMVSDRDSRIMKVADNINSISSLNSKYVQTEQTKNSNQCYTFGTENLNLKENIQTSAMIVDTLKKESENICNSNINAIFETESNNVTRRNKYLQRIYKPASIALHDTCEYLTGKHESNLEAAQMTCINFKYDKQMTTNRRNCAKLQSHSINTKATHTDQRATYKKLLNEAKFHNADTFLCIQPCLNQSETFKIIESNNEHCQIHNEYKHKEESIECIDIPESLNSSNCETGRTYAVHSPVFIHHDISNTALITPEFYQSAYHYRHHKITKSLQSISPDSLDMNFNSDELQREVLLPPSYFQ